MIEVEGERLERVGLDLPVRKIELGQVTDREGGLLSGLAGQLSARQENVLHALESAPGGNCRVPAQGDRACHGLVRSGPGTPLFYQRKAHFGVKKV